MKNSTFFSLKRLISTGLFFASTVQAGTVGDYDRHGGWYAGVNLGSNFVKTQKNLTYPVGEPNMAFAEYTSGYTGFHAQLLGGFDFNISDSFSLALEGNLDSYNGRSQYMIQNFFLQEGALAKEQLKYGYSLFILPKYQVLQQVALFVGPGVSRSQFSINSGMSTAGNVGLTGSFKKWVAAWGIKAGARIGISSKMDLALTYQYQNYRSTQNTGMESITESYVSGKYKPTSNTAMIGLVWHA